jgi:hypothetical protein
MDCTFFAAIVTNVCCCGLLDVVLVFVGLHGPLPVPVRLILSHTIIAVSFAYTFFKYVIYIC